MERPEFFPLFDCWSSARSEKSRRWQRSLSRLKNNFITLCCESVRQDEKYYAMPLYTPRNNTTSLIAMAKRKWVDSQENRERRETRDVQKMRDVHLSIVTRPSTMSHFHFTKFRLLRQQNWFFKLNQ